MGLGKETVRKELEKEFVRREFITGYVSSTNTASLQLCQSLGAGKVLEIAWVNILMNRYRAN